MAEMDSKFYDIPGYGGLYQANKLGKIRRVERKDTLGRTLKEKELVGGVNSAGYILVTIKKPGGVFRSVQVQQLIVDTFLPKIKGKNFIDHINRDRTDNRLVNLRWVTRRENNTNRKKKSSLPTGVRFHSDLKLRPYQAKIVVNGKDKTLGYFKSPELAHSAYKKELERLNNLPTILILGHGRHGKDTAAEYFRDHFGLKFASSSQSAADIFIYEHLKNKYGYSTPEECYKDRSNRRKEWHNLICWYNRNDKARLAKEIMSKTNCYVGMRSNAEAQACLDAGLFDLIIWVDASKRLPLESSESFDIDIDIADIIIDNNSTQEVFEKRLDRIGKQIFK